MIKYYLMHKNDVCGSLAFDENSGRILEYKDNKEGFSPFLGNCDVNRIRKWWEMRAVPASRTMIQEMIQKTGCLNTESYLAKNLALSMTDTYWICPADAPLDYDDIKFSNFALYNDGKIPYHNATSYDPNASLGGQMEKYWDLDYNPPVLVKESYKYYGQQSINEVFATYLHELQNSEIPFVKYYGTITEDHGILCKCSSFTSEKIELISAYEIVESSKIRNSTSLYDGYIETCVENGISREQIQDFMDYMILTDFVISNTDEHLMNFGVLRDADTMKFVGPAPIFDSGNSMFFADDRKIPYTRVELLERKITSFYQTEEKMLAKVQNRKIVKEDLFPTPEKVKELYISSNLPEWKADMISQNYTTKLRMLHEFQHGKTISLYHEKQKEKQKKVAGKISADKFIMIYDNSDQGKTDLLKQLCQDMIREGYKEISASKLYPVENAFQASQFLFHQNAVTHEIKVIPDCDHSVTKISAKDIYEEICQKGRVPNEEMVNQVVEIRIKTALLSGASVILDASDLRKTRREHYLQLAEECHVKTKELHVMKNEHKLLNGKSPSEEKGWDKIEKHQ